ncbi:hypothetical protein [Tomitella cavernea]|nr:hypothetical protein [Tomitella cavernea]
MRRVNWRRVEAAMETWGPFVLLPWFALGGGPAFVRDVVDDPTPWHWFVFLVWVFVITTLVWTCASRIRHRGRKPRQQALAPGDVPAADVAAAVAAHPDRIAAIRALREQHRGLGLADAAALIDGAARQ